jgi:hypothetical protein
MATPNCTLEMTLRGRVVAWLAALATGAAWLAGDQNARLAAAMLTAPLLVDFVLKQRRLHDTTIRLAPRRTVVGSAYTETIVVEHRGRRALRECLLAEPRTMRTEPAALLPTLLPFRPARVEIRQRSHVRSHVLERVFVLVSHWPLGLWKTRAVVSFPSDLVTEPARVPLRQEIVAAAADAEPSPQDRSLLPGPEFLSLREHLPGEDARGVHALRSAAVGTLIRRVTRGRLPRTVALVLDLRRPPARSAVSGLRRLEWSLGACASLAELLFQHGVETRCLVLAGEPVRLDLREPEDLRELLTLLSEVGLGDHQPVPPELLAELRGLTHCFWIAAGKNLYAHEQRLVTGGVTLVLEEDA